jgi:hypothetical protein
MTSDIPHPADPAKPGHIKLVRLAAEGKLAHGDLVETYELGVCEVVLINTADKLTVKARDGACHVLSGIGWGSRGARLAATHGVDEADEENFASAPRG